MNIGYGDGLWGKTPPCWQAEETEADLSDLDDAECGEIFGCSDGEFIDALARRLIQAASNPQCGRITVNELLADCDPHGANRRWLADTAEARALENQERRLSRYAA